MKSIQLAYLYIKWHYSRAIVDFWQNVWSAVWFLFHFFSIPVLLATFFSPWRRLTQENGPFFERIILNNVMRVFGMIARTIIIVIGLAVTVAVLLVSALMFCMWIVLPILILVLIFNGIEGLITKTA